MGKTEAEETDAGEQAGVGGGDGTLEDTRDFLSVMALLFGPLVPPQPLPPQPEKTPLGQPSSPAEWHENMTGGVLWDRAQFTGEGRVGAAFENREQGDGSNGGDGMNGEEGALVEEQEEKQEQPAELSMGNGTGIGPAALDGGDDGGL